MRPSALLLLLLPICGGETLEEPHHVRVKRLLENGTDSRNATGPCFAADTTEEEQAKLYEIFNGECISYKDDINKCCSAFNKCAYGREMPSRDAKMGTKYTECGKTQALCLDRNFDTVDFPLGICQTRATPVILHGLRHGEIGKDFVLAPSMGLTRELYGNCTVASAQIDSCAWAFKKCADLRKNRPKGGAGPDKEPYECSSKATECLDEVMDTDRTRECAVEVGYALGVMVAEWKKIVDGKLEWKEEEEKEGGDTPRPAELNNPFTLLLEHMQKEWDISWWAALGILVAIALAAVATCSCICYCCAAAGLKRQRQKRRMQRRRAMKERGADRYSTVESAQPSSVRVSRYSVEDAEEPTEKE